MFKLGLLLFVITLSLINVQAQIKDNVSDFTQTVKIKPIAIAEMWSTYSYGEVVDGEAYGNQFDVHLRRLKFGAKGTAIDRLDYSFLFHADRLGENEYSSTRNKYRGVGLWHAMVIAQLSKRSQLMNLTAGYYSVAVSRESNSVFKVLGTLDKSQPDWYLRKFLTGKGNGIESGIGMGGFATVSKINISYRTSVFVPEAYQHAKGSSLLYSGRVMLSVGKESENKFKYLINNKNWKRQKNIEIGLGGAYQQDGFVNDTVMFSTSGSYGGDIRFHYNGAILEGAYYELFRSGDNMNNFSAYLWHVKALYNFKIKNKHLEACLSYQDYSGMGNKTLFKYIGADRTIDAGINWYINNDKVKLTLHYINQEGKTGMNNGDYIASSLLISL